MRKNNRQFKINAIKEALNGNPEKLRELFSQNVHYPIYFVDREKETATNKITKEVISLSEYKQRAEIFEKLTGQKTISIEFVKSKN